MRYPVRIIFGALLAASAGFAAARIDSRLADAAKKSDKTEVRALLQQHLDVNATAVDGDTALHWAAYWDDLDTARLLLDSGANANTTNRYGVTPLSLAATNGSAAMIDLLLKAKADPNAALPGGFGLEKQIDHSRVAGRRNSADDGGANRQSGRTQIPASERSGCQGER